MSSTIHKTAIIDKKTNLGKNVKVGPYSIIGPNVQIKNNVIIHSHVNIDVIMMFAHTLNYPERKKNPIKGLDLTSLKNLSFEEVDERKFPSINLARIILKKYLI